MQDGIIKGVGNSRFLKSVPAFLNLYPTYEAFAEALIAGTLPVDLNGINEAGWTQLGTALNKANLLSDATAGLLGGDESMTPDGALSFLAGAVRQMSTKGNCSIKLSTYQGTGTYGSANPTVIPFSRKPAFFIVRGPSIMLFATSADTTGLAQSLLRYQNAMYFWAGTTFSWSGSNALLYVSDQSKADAQLNASGVTYQVIAFYQES